MTVTAAIDLAAYRANIALMQARIAPARLMVMVKADAYGHGLVPMARAAEASGVDLIGVLDGASGLALRSAGIEARLFAWLFAPEEHYGSLIDAAVDLGVSRLDQLERVAAAVHDRPARIHLKIDTGLHRNGASATEWPDLVGAALGLHHRGLVELAGTWTHIGEASDAEDTAAIARFDEALTVARGLGAPTGLRHLAASAAGFARADARFDAVRVGAFTFGIAPGSGVGPGLLGLAPVMTLSAPVTAVQVDAAGCRHATVAAGYLDGVPPMAAGRVSVAVGGALHPVTAVDAGSLELRVPDSVRVGDTATLFGSGAAGEDSLQVWADALGTIGEELVVRVAPSVVRVYLD